MSRILKVMIVLLAITAMAMPAMAADNFSVSGQARVFGYYLDDGGEQTDTYAYQRLRVQGTFKATENVSATFRADFSEGTWGSDAGSGRLGQIQDQMDRAYLDINFDALSLRAGTQFVGFGQSSALQWNETGLTVKTKGDMPFTIAFAVDNDNNTDEVEAGFEIDQDTGAIVAVTAEDAANNSDKLLFAIGTKIGMFDLFAGTENDSDESVYVLGAAGTFDLDAVKLTGEIDFFTGDASDTADAKGLQGYIDASMGVSEMTRVGGAFYYAQGQDGGDVQYAQLGNYFGQWDPLARGPFADEDFLFSAIPYTAFNASNSKQAVNGAGVIAGQLYVDVNYNDATSMTASIAYAEPEEDANAMNNADSLVIGNLGLTYKLMDNANFIGQIQYAEYDYTGAEEQISVGTGLVVTF